MRGVHGPGITVKLDLIWQEAISSRARSICANPTAIFHPRSLVALIVQERSLL
jgi:hypothetical protein